MVCKGSKIVVPMELRRSVLETAHESHVGITKMKAVLRGLCYWLGMNTDIEDYVCGCTACTVYQKRADSPLLKPVMEKEISAWSTIAVDLTGPSEVLDSKMVLTVIDLYSRYPECFILKDRSAAEIINRMRNIFARHGFPKRVISDNGMSFTSQEFQDFLNTCRVKSIKSSL